MRSEPSSFANDGRTLFDFAKPDVGLAWQPDLGGVPIRRSVVRPGIQTSA
jgi:hypothetical protein